MERLFHFCVLALLVASAYCGPCRDGWVFNSLEESCYAIPSGAQGNWPEAMAYCAAMSSELAVIDSSQEQNFILNLIQNYTFTSDKDFWIGAVDILEESVFIWATRLTPVSEFFWGTGQPDNAHGRQGCVRLEHELGWKWGDGDCASKEYFVCEQEADG